MGEDGAHGGAVDRVDLLDVTGPPEVFSLLQRELDEPTGYRVVLAALTLDPVTTSAGVRGCAHPCQHRPAGREARDDALVDRPARRIDDLRQHIARNLRQPLTVTDLAWYVHVSDRQLTRIFKTELGTTPAAYIESARLEAARNQLETTDDTVDRIAPACGFGTVDTLARSFRRALRITPTEYRERFRTTAD